MSDADPMTPPLEGVTTQQRDELEAMLGRLSGLWAELTKAAANADEERVAAIRQEIAACRERVDQIKRAGTIGSA